MTTVEYIWLDGSEEMPQLRSKTRVFSEKTLGEIGELPDWSFDGGSTQQGDLKDSDRILKPVRLYRNPFSEGNYMALCEVLNPDLTPHDTNTRAQLRDINPDKNVWFGFEQEYTLTDPLGKPLVPEDIVQGDFYCGVGAGRVIGRLVSEEHLENCDKAGIVLFGTNAEVMISQWEFQTNPGSALVICDVLWMARYILERGTEKFNMRASYHPKLYSALNGAGCHVNVSTSKTRDEGGVAVIEGLMKSLEDNHEAHMEVYGSGNELRLTGEHETSDYNKFTWGVGDRGASVRVPAHVHSEGRGYFEDRRPAATCDPYLVTSKLLGTLG